MLGTARLLMSSPSYCSPGWVGAVLLAVLVALLPCLGGEGGRVHAAPNTTETTETTGAKLESAGGMGGFSIYREGKWAVVSSQLTNPTDQTLRPLVMTALDKQPRSQFASRVWLPPRSRRAVMTPLLVSEVDRNERSVSAQPRRQRPRLTAQTIAAARVRCAHTHCDHPGG